jgi:M6 family metalloprotease-like protein
VRHGVDGQPRLVAQVVAQQLAGGGHYTTSTPRNGAPGNIRIDDYTIQPVYDCQALEINQIGVFAHELGHGFGLPDLYCTASNCHIPGSGAGI